MKPLLCSATLGSVLLLGLPGCSSQPQVEAQGRPETGQRLAAFFEEVFQAELDRDPDRAARLGFERPNDRWTDLSDDALRREHEIHQQNLRRLRTEFPFAELDEASQLSYRLFEYRTEQALGDFPWRFHSYPVHQMRGVHTTVATFLMDIHRVENVEDARDYISRIRGVRDVMSQTVANLVAREERDILPPRFVFPMVLTDCRNLIAGRPFEESDRESPILADITAKLEALELGDGQRRELLDEARRALVEAWEPAYRELIEVLERQAKLATDEDGAWKFPDGAKFYDHALRRMTTTRLDAEAIHKLGLAEVARIHGAMEEIRDQVGFEGSLQEFFVHLRTDAGFYYANDEEGRAAYLADATAIVDVMRARLSEVFGILPRADMEVRAVEAYREASAGKAFYSPGTPDGSRPGIYYANLYDMRDMPRYQMEALAYHEGIPGHHMQNSIARELEGVPAFRKFGRYTAYGEGWGLYSELLPKEMGFYADPYSDFGRLAMELWRASRLVVDTGIHAQQWTRDQAIAYLMTNTPNPEGDCRKAIERYIVMPGQATAYKIGMLEILRLRERARAQLGEDFSLRGFHDTLLGSGPLPLEILAEEIAAWVAGSQG